MPRMLGMALLFVALYFAAPCASAQEISDVKKDEAKALFKQGVELFKDGKHAQALEKFKKTYEIWPQWRFNLNIGLCYKELAMYLDAKKSLDAFMQEGFEQKDKSEIDYYESKKGLVEDALTELSAIIVVLDIEVVPDGATIKLDGKIAGTTPLPGPVDANPGAHVIEIVADGFVTFREEFFVTEGQKKAFDVTLEAKAVSPVDPVGPVVPVEPAGKVRHKAAPVFWVMGGLTLALAGGAAATGALTVMADKDVSALDASATKAASGEIAWTGADWDEYEKDREDIVDKGKLLGPITTGLMIAAGAALVGTVVTGIVLNPFAPKAESKDAPDGTEALEPEPAVSLSVAPVPLVGGGGMVVVGGTF